MNVKVVKIIQMSNVTLFKVYDSNKVAWKSAVYNTINQLKPLEYIYSKHFSPDDVITKYSQTPSDVIMPKVN